MEPFLEHADQSDTKDVVINKFLDSVSVKSVGASYEEQHNPKDVFCNNVNHKSCSTTQQAPLSTEPQATHNPQENLLGKCMEKLVDINPRLTTATLEQNYITRKQELTRQLPNMSIPVFNGDPLQYPIWLSFFNAFIDSKLIDAKMKLNFLNSLLLENLKGLLNISC